MNKIKKRLNSLQAIGSEFGYEFMLQCLIRRLISFKLYERYIYDYLKEYFCDIICQYQKIEDEIVDYNVENSKVFHVWTSWWQGGDQALEVVKVCIDSQKLAFERENVEYHVITKDNWFELITLPDHIIDKVENGQITLTHFSDILRAELLKEYGGLWIDATVYCTGEIPSELLNRSFYTVKTHKESDCLTLRRWTGFLIGSKRNSILFRFMSEAFSYYWQKKNALVAYLLIDYLIALAFDSFQSVRKDIESVPQSNRELWGMLRRLNVKYDEVEWNRQKENTCFFKLSYRDEFNGGPLSSTTPDGNISYWSVISQQCKK